jgi:hypothetical protein
VDSGFRWNDELDFSGAESLSLGMKPRQLHLLSPDGEQTMVKTIENGSPFELNDRIYKI